MRAHIIENGYVINTIEVDSLDIFPDLIDAEQGGSIGDLYIDGEFQKPAAPTPDWAALIAARRWLAETSGTTFGGMPIDTDDRSKLLINGASLRADQSADYVLRWKTSGGFVDLTAAQVLAIADAVSEHVQLCFDREDALLVAVADGLITAEMLEEGWPA